MNISTPGPRSSTPRELDPDDTTSALWYATELVMPGYTAQGNAVLDHLLEVDPMLPTALLWRGADYAYAGDLSNAERLLKRAARRQTGVRRPGSLVRG